MAELKEATEPVHIRVAQAVVSPFFYHPTGRVGAVFLTIWLCPTLGVALAAWIAGLDPEFRFIPWLVGAGLAGILIPLLGFLVLLPRLLRERREERALWEETERSRSGSDQRAEAE